MHADVAVDDHFQACEAHAGIRQLRKIERPLGIGHVHHDLQWRGWHLFQVGGDALERQQSVEDQASVAFGTGNGDVATVRNRFKRVAAANHRRNTQFAGDDRSVTGAAAAIGHDRRRTFHDRFPVRIGHVRDQHVARLQLVHFCNGANDPRLAGADLVTDRTAFTQHRSLATKMEPLKLGCARARLDRFRACLNDEQGAADAVLRPLDIHRPTVMFFDHQ